MSARPGRGSLTRGVARAAGLAAACLPLLAAEAPVAAEPAPAAQGTVVEVIIRDYRFEPAELKIRAGSTVKWINDEKRTSHSVLFIGEGGSESERFFPGESWQRSFPKPGVYRYTCGPHPEMQGVVEVTE